MFRRRLYLIPLLLGVASLACGARTELRGGFTDLGDSDSDSDASDKLEETEFCEDFTLNYASSPATVLLLLDSSGSMTSRIGSSTRWQLVGDALFDERDGLVTQLADSVRFGLAFYSSLDGFAGGMCPTMTFSSVDIDQEDQLRAQFNATEPLRSGDTPTGEAMQVALDRLVDDHALGPKYLILITDGQPDTCTVPDPQRGQPEALAAAQRAFELGVNTFIVGVSSDIAPDHLQQMANVARGVRPGAIWDRDDDAIQPIQASEQRGVLASQIKGVLGDVRSCTILVSPEVNEQGSVELDHQILRPNVDYVVMGNSLQLGAAACDRVLADATELVVRLHCRD